MFQFILKRLAYGFLVILGVIVIVFLLFFVIPGDPATVITGGKGDAATLEAVRKDLGLDRSKFVQLLFYLNNLSPLSIHSTDEATVKKFRYSTLINFGGYALAWKKPYLGRSYQSNKPVDEILLEDIEGTLWLAIVSMFFATIVGIAFGTVAAIKQNTFTDYALVTVSVLGISIPSFVLAILISNIFGFYLADYTGLSLTGSLWELNPINGKSELRLQNIILPAFTLALRPLAIIVQLTRSSMLDVLTQDYIRTARAKGLYYHTIILKHALKNALNPVITAVSGWLASLMTGAFFIEYIFNWKGLGRTTITALAELDLPVIMGATIVIAFIFVIVNIVVDILYAAIDPRIRLH